MNDDVWSCSSHGAANVFVAAQIIVPATGDKDTLAPTLVQFLHHPHTQKTRATNLLTWFNIGTVPHAAVKEAMEQFAVEVMPELRA